MVIIRCMRHLWWPENHHEKESRRKQELRPLISSFSSLRFRLHRKHVRILFRERYSPKMESNLKKKQEFILLVLILTLHGADIFTQILGTMLPPKALQRKTQPTCLFSFWIVLMEIWDLLDTTMHGWFNHIPNSNAGPLGCLTSNLLAVKTFPASLQPRT